MQRAAHSRRPARIHTHIYKTCGRRIICQRRGFVFTRVRSLYTDRRGAYTRRYGRVRKIEGKACVCVYMVMREGERQKGRKGRGSSVGVEGDEITGSSERGG